MDLIAMTQRRIFLATALASAAATLAVRAPAMAAPASAEDLHRESEQALQMLIRANPAAAAVAKVAAAVLVFPSIIKAGLILAAPSVRGSCDRRASLTATTIPSPHRGDYRLGHNPMAMPCF